MVYTFDSYIALLAGVNAAVIFQNIGFWVAKNKANEKHFHDGKYWTYNSIRAFQSLFPFLSERQVQFAIQKLIECDLIEEGSFNELGFDRTKWYTLTNCGECLFTKDFSHLTNLSNGFDKNVKCICQKCQTNTICKHIYKNTDINNICANEAESITGIPNEVYQASANEAEKSAQKETFERFWEAYPKKRDKAKAEAAFKKAIKKTTLDVILSTLNQQKKSKEWQKENGQFIPYPTTWLNGERWNDEVGVESKPIDYGKEGMQGW